MIKRLFSVLLLCLTLSPALATITFRITEEGGDVIIRATGSVNTAALVGPGGVTNCGFGAGSLNPANAIVCVGTGGAQVYSGLVGPGSIGPGGAIGGSTSVGQEVNLAGHVGQIYLPVGYVSGSPVVGSVTFAASTIASLGVTPGTYTYTFGAGPTADTVVVITGPPVPQTITFANPGQQTVGNSLTLAATATSGLVATFTSATPAVCTVSNGTTLTFIGVGNCTVNADQGGNATFSPAPQVAQTFAVLAAVATSAIPTLQTWALMLLSLLVASFGWARMRRR